MKKNYVMAGVNGAGKSTFARSFLITKTDSDSKEKAKSIREGIEYLCYPFREDLSKFVRSPLRDENDPEQNFLKADLSTTENQITFNDHMAEMINKDIKLSVYAHEILSYLKNH